QCPRAGADHSHQADQRIRRASRSRRVARRGSRIVSKASSSTTPISTIPMIAHSSISVLLVPVQHVCASSSALHSGYDPGPANTRDQSYDPLQNHSVERMLNAKNPLHRMPQAAAGVSVQPRPYHHERTGLDEVHTRTPFRKDAAVHPLRTHVAPSGTLVPGPIAVLIRLTPPSCDPSPEVSRQR